MALISKECLLTDTLLNFTFNRLYTIVHQRKNFQQWYKAVLSCNCHEPVFYTTLRQPHDTPSCKTEVLRLISNVYAYNTIYYYIYD